MSLGHVRWPSAAVQSRCNCMPSPPAAAVVAPASRRPSHASSLPHRSTARQTRLPAPHMHRVARLAPGTAHCWEADQLAHGTAGTCYGRVFLLGMPFAVCIESGSGGARSASSVARSWRCPNTVERRASCKARPEKQQDIQRSLLETRHASPPAAALRCTAARLQAQLPACKTIWGAIEHVRTRPTPESQNTTSAHRRLQRLGRTGSSSRTFSGV